MSGIDKSFKRVDKVCKHCAKPFTVANYRRDTAVYCSRKCLAMGTRVETTTNCQECGAVFTHIACRSNKAKYCSRPCYYKAMHKKGTVKYSCKHCHKEFFGSPSEKRIYCSRACVNKDSKLTWRAKATSVRKIMKNRNLILECQRCGYAENTRILGVHHKDRDRSNNDPSNLEVLCPNCHSIEHSKHIAHR